MIVLLAAMAVNAFAQKKHDSQSSYRDGGLGGSIGIVDEGRYFIGVEGSVGFKLGQHLYTGAGARLTGIPGLRVQGTQSLFSETRYYFNDRSAKSSLLADFKIGAGRSEALFGTNQKGETKLMVEPGLGWSLAICKSNGLSCSLSVPLYFYKSTALKQDKFKELTKVLAVPKLSVALEF